jgi:hypothetical protein
LLVWRLVYGDGIELAETVGFLLCSAATLCCNQSPYDFHPLAGITVGVDGQLVMVSINRGLGNFGPVMEAHVQRRDIPT